MGKNAFQVREKKTLDTHSQTENNWNPENIFVLYVEDPPEFLPRSKA